MIELQKTVFNAMKVDSELLEMLGLSNSAIEADISKRLLPSPPNMEHEDTIIHFRFPATYKSFTNPMWENRPVQFRIWAKDSALITQQKISVQLQAIFVNQDFAIKGVNHSKFFYTGEGDIPGNVGEMYGWFIELRIQTQVIHFSEGG